MYFRNDLLKSPSWMDLSKGNMVSVPKRYLNLNDSILKQRKQITREVFIRGWNKNSKEMIFQTQLHI